MVPTSLYSLKSLTGSLNTLNRHPISNSFTWYQFVDYSFLGDWWVLSDGGPCLPLLHHGGGFTDPPCPPLGRVRHATRREGLSVAFHHRQGGDCISACSTGILLGGDIPLLLTACSWESDLGVAACAQCSYLSVFSHRCKAVSGVPAEPRHTQLIQPRYGLVYKNMYIHTLVFFRLIHIWIKI